MLQLQQLTASGSGSKARKVGHRPVPAAVPSGLWRAWRHQPTVCHSSKLDKAPVASKEKEKSPEPSSDQESDDEEFLQMLSSIPPAFVTAGVNAVEALFVMSLATLLGDFLSVDPWAPFTLDWAACTLALQTSIPIMACLGLIALLQTGIPAPTQQRLNMMSEAEDEITVASSGVVIDLEWLLPSGPRTVEPKQPEPVAATQDPLKSGLQVFKWWLTKPWFFSFTSADMALITASSALKLVASEVMARGLVVAVLANWLHDAVANADSSSVLFWGKVFQLSGPEPYRWFGVVLVAAGSVWAVLQESDRMRQWARLVLFQLAKEATQKPEEAGGKSGSSSSSTSISAAAAAQQASAAVLTAAATSAAMSATGSVASSAAAAAAATTMSTAAAAALEGMSVTGSARASTSSQSVNSSSSSSSRSAAGMNSFSGSASFMKLGAASSKHGSGGKAGGMGAETSSALLAAGGAGVGADEEGGPQPPVGMDFTGDNLKGPSQLIVTRNAKGDVEVTYNNEVQPSNMVPTKEDGLIYGLAAAFGTAQVAQLAFLYGTTGSITATFVARLCLEVAGNALVQHSARGGPPKYASEAA